MAEANVFTMDENVHKLYEQPEIKGKQFIEDPELEKLGKQVIEEHDIEIGEASIGYMLVYPNVSKKVAGRCKRTTKETQYYSGNHYLIQMSGETWDMLDEETRKILMYHELLHIKAVFKAKKQEWKYKIRKHDFEDFREIIKEHGIDWFETVQGTTGSLYDLEPEEENEVQI